VRGQPEQKSGICCIFTQRNSMFGKVYEAFFKITLFHYLLQCIFMLVQLDIRNVHNESTSKYYILVQFNDLMLIIKF
jgi:hypothetical protein